MPGYILIVLMLVLLWMLLIRPQRRRQVEQQQLLGRLEPGDEVVTAGGLYGTIEEVGDEEVRLAIAPGTSVRVAKRAVAGIVSTADEPDETPDETHPLGESADGSDAATLSTERG